MIERGIHIAMNLPMAKGMGCGSVEHIASCFSQSQYLSCDSFDSFSLALDEHISFTSDLGTDLGLRSLQLVCPSEVLPAWLRPLPRVRLEVDGAVADGDLMCDQEASSPSTLRCLLRNAMDVSGGMHITSNLGNDLSEHLAHFDEHYKDLQAIEPLATEQWFRERFEEKCLNLPNAPTLPAWNGGKLYAAKWLCVFEWCKAYLDATHEVLKGWFNVARFTAGMRQKKKKDGEQEFSADRVSKLLRSGFFESYTLMVVLLGAVLGKLTAWIESCPCHENVIQGMRTKAKRRSAFCSNFAMSARLVALWAGAAHRSWQPVSCSTFFSDSLKWRRLSWWRPSQRT